MLKRLCICSKAVYAQKAMPKAPIKGVKGMTFADLLPTIDSQGYSSRLHAFCVSRNCTANSSPSG